MNPQLFPVLAAAQLKCKKCLPKMEASRLTEQAPGRLQADCAGSYGSVSSGANTSVLTSGKTLTLPSQEASGEELWFHFLSTLASFFTSLKTSYFH